MCASVIVRVLLGTLFIDGHVNKNIQTPRKKIYVALCALLISTFEPPAVGMAAVPASQVQTYEFDIPAQLLNDSLEAVALALRLKLLYASELVDGKTAPALQGRFSGEQAMRQLLAGTSLTYEISDGLIVVRNRDVAANRTAVAQAANRVASASGVNPDGSPDFRSGRFGAQTQARGDSAGEAQAATGAPLEVVTITGSRLITNDSENPTPVTLVSATQLLDMSPGPVAQSLAMLPALLSTSSQGGQGVGPQPQINLRGIGSTRNLILFDGHRLPPTTGGNAVDINLIPTMLLKRIEIVTGGASAVYGSDAVSGVVNYVVDNGFDGIRLNLQAGSSTYDDDHVFSAGIAAGTTLLGGRAHGEFSYQMFNDPGIHDRSDRGWGRGLWSMQGAVSGSSSAAGSAMNPWFLYGNTHFNVTTFGGLINTGVLAGLQFAQNGVLSPFIHGASTGSPQVEVGGDGGYYTSVSAYGGQNLQQAFARLDYDFTETSRAYLEAAAAKALNWQNLANAEVRSRAIGFNNAFLTSLQPAYRAQINSELTANPFGSFGFSRILTADQFPAPRNELIGRQLLLLSGVEGNWRNYKWKVGLEHSLSQTVSTNRNNLSNARLYAAMNAVLDPATNRIVCNAALVNPAVYGDCVPLNLFGPTASSRAAFDYIRQPSRNRSQYVMNDVTADITGAPISGPAGPIDMALSGEWRRLSYAVTGNPLPGDPVDCAGIQFNCSSGMTAYFSNVTANFPEASLDVSELAFEAQVPLLKDRSLVKSWGLNSALRYTDYETSGTVWTWKAGSTWAMNDAWHVRVARSRDIRAPSLQNLFAPMTISTTNITDLHTGVTGNVTQIDQGNPDLIPEKADTWTVGIAWMPPSLEGVSVSMDYYRIRINDGLNGTSTRQPATMQACESSGGASPICDLYVRPFPFSNTSPANFPISIRNLTLNTAGLLAYGVDAEVNFARQLGGRRFSARLLMNYQPHLIYNLGPAGVLDVGGAADGVGGLPPTPNLRGLLQATYAPIPDLHVTLQQRYRNALKQNGSPLIAFAIGKQPPVWYTDLTLNYKLQFASGMLETFANIKNLFNRQPDPWASTGGNSQIGSFGGWAQGDDPLGRYFTVGVRYRM